MESQRLFNNHNGAGYRHFVKEVIEKKRARSYLEIGVRNGELLDMIDVPSIGVDPYFQIDRNIIGRKKKLFLFQITSDEFFRDYDPRILLGTPLDVAFLDGLHQFEYLLRDFINAEAFSHRNGIIMLDDCLPLNVEMTERVFDPEARTDAETSRMWTGDVWKVLKILKTIRPDLLITAVDTQPTGNIAITNLDPLSTILKEKYHEIVAEFMVIKSDYSALSNFYQSIDIVSTNDIMSDFQYSIYLGP